jgi:hypothetical protein
MRSIHSERSALNNLLIGLGNRLFDPKICKKGMYMVNFAFNRYGVIKISKPCIHCANAIKNSVFRFKRIYWSVEGGGFEFSNQSSVDVDCKLSSGESREKR